MHLPHRAVHPLALAVATLAGFALTAPAAGEIVYARRNKLTTEVIIRGKFPNTQFRIYQSGLPGGGGGYTPTAHVITTGPGNGEETGVGRITIRHSDGEIGVGHHLRLGLVATPGQMTDQHPNGFVVQAPTYPDYHPGTHRPVGALPIIIPQAVGGPGEEGVLLETWEPGTVFTFNLDPLQGSFINEGCAVMGEGDLQVQLVSVTPQSVAFAVVADPTPFPPNNVRISGLGVNVVAPCNTPMMFSIGMTGTSRVFFNGVQRDVIVNPPPPPPQPSQPYPFAPAMVRALADVGGAGGVPGGDGQLNNNDFVVYIDRFFAGDPRADIGGTGGVAGADGALNNNDFVVFIDAFFEGC